MWRLLFVLMIAAVGLNFGLKWSPPPPDAGAKRWQPPPEGSSRQVSAVMATAKCVPQPALQRAGAVASKPS